jgi:hypothetical protein
MSAAKPATAHVRSSGKMTYRQATKGLKTAKKGGKLTPHQKELNELLAIPKANKIGFSPVS